DNSSSRSRRLGRGGLPRCEIPLPQGHAGHEKTETRGERVRACRGRRQSQPLARCRGNMQETLEPAGDMVASALLHVRRNARRMPPI
ncbi:hypothetical protein LTS06_012747, partial [Exophiala xenobiotica]